MINNITMLAQDAVAANMAECFVTINNRRYNFMQMKNLEASIKKNKTKVPILGKSGSGNKSNGWEGTGKATIYYNQSVMRELLVLYKDTGVDTYFDVQIANEDPTSSVGRQTMLLIGCNLDGGILAKFDAEGGNLDEEINFTFEDFKMPDTFEPLDGML